MQYACGTRQMKLIDETTISKIGIPATVMMEKAAMAVATHAVEIITFSDKIIAVCGTGNNGGDGIAAARILFLKGYNTEIYIAGDRKKLTKETKLQLKIARNLGIKILRKPNFSKYDAIIDAIFGTGLSRNITGDIKKLIEAINASGKKVVSVDVPSGVCADDGKIMPIAVNANMTVTFGYVKTGCLLFPGAEYTGFVYVEDIGFAPIVLDEPPTRFYFDEPVESLMLPRKKNSNKGTYGRVLVVAGSKNMSGAAYFAAAAAYNTGAGIVRILTDESNREILQKQLPEAILTTYSTEGGAIVPEDVEVIKDTILWASVIVIGPGLGTSAPGASLVNYVLNECKVPLVLDADGLNIIARVINDKLGEKAEPAEKIAYLAKLLPAGTILTPHKKELSNLTGIPMKDLVDCLIDSSSICTENNDLIFVKKDVRTIVSFGSSDYINVSGNDGMATAGSGDVLAGIIGGLIAQGEMPRMAAMLGCYLHGTAGNIAAQKKGVRSMLASDILEGIPVALQKRGE
ncbi:MAG: NAD(P)H-hydrate dehydratase [Lachnospiraceae bacterium]|nr:NAD(P)H-hydrate dehydratase [Lachnospiraceae bacterium]